ncbi:penicillin acylase family protein [Bradyrhizobium sp. 1]|uniref:penicillin acylase family protein n=1 Tax=Bradyrhizobium sp. 1 TaxID=241591 RepID=UPI001FFA1DC1|nr:penicillin acylase family protein [Bradyrhizobium sp. 1]MCK1391500.1 penicillin acylase family protein [Bradyrhizobium sp. 1]
MPIRKASRRANSSPTLPSWLRNDDTAFLRGWDWDRALTTALERAAGINDGTTWSDLHHVRMAHPLSSALPQAVKQLEPPGIRSAATTTPSWPMDAFGRGPVSTYGAVARYVFDVGNWNDCAWVVPRRVEPSRESALCRSALGVGLRGNGPDVVRLERHRE